MPINQVTATQISQQIQNIGVQINALFSKVQLFANVVVGIGTTALQAAPYNFSSADATLLFNACQDLLHFILVYQGLEYVTAGATQNSGVPTANDATHFGYPFNINVNQCDGFGF